MENYIVIKKLRKGAVTLTNIKNRKQKRSLSRENIEKETIKLIETPKISV